jgi:hypothetical protein
VKDEKAVEANNTRNLGRNVQRLIARKMALDAVPRGGGMVDALNFLSSKDNITKGARVAAAWVKTACDVVRSAAEPNPFKQSTDDEIAAYLLEQIAQKEQSHESR